MDLEQVVGYLKVLAHETRLRLLGLLAAQERSVGELAEILALKEPTISHHLAKLSEAELVTMRPQGTVHLYRVNSEALRELSRDLFTPERVAGFAPARQVDSWEKKVLRTYVVESRLTKIPDVRKKRDVVLRWLAGHFEEDRRYSEREVNEIIGRVHSDFATLRRELVGARLMQRAEGIYWRVDQVPAAA
ncbi:MAG: metalloregulator ArsR/SmtB family transcription factor [Gemmatimonadetes bacterium]|nr:metalloregulator ArsR/SmtB family transcription factor [Gemmatimonadota bacterium]